MFFLRPCLYSTVEKVSEGSSVETWTDIGGMSGDVGKSEEELRRIYGDTYDRLQEEAEEDIVTDIKCKNCGCLAKETVEKHFSSKGSFLRSLKKASLASSFEYFFCFVGAFILVSFFVALFIEHEYRAHKAQEFMIPSSHLELEWPVFLSALGLLCGLSIIFFLSKMIFEMKSINRALVTMDDSSAKVFFEKYYMDSRNDLCKSIKDSVIFGYYVPIEPAVMAKAAKKYISDIIVRV